jgi:hypothetical protein
MQSDEEGQTAVNDIYQALLSSEIVEGPEELYALVEQLWPQLLHKVKPPRWRMH